MSPRLESCSLLGANLTARRNPTQKSVSTSARVKYQFPGSKSTDRPSSRASRGKTCRPDGMQPQRLLAAQPHSSSEHGAKPRYGDFSQHCLPH